LYPLAVASYLVALILPFHFDQHALNHKRWSIRLWASRNSLKVRTFFHCKIMNRRNVSFCDHFVFRSTKTAPSELPSSLFSKFFIDTTNFVNKDHFYHWFCSVRNSFSLNIIPHFVWSKIY
jgi:hypothetical protein